MSDELRTRVAAKVLGLKQTERPSMDEVEVEAKRMEVIDKTLGTARKLSGTDALQEELRRRDEAIQKTQEERDKISKELEQSRSEVVEAKLGAKIDSLSQAIEKGASKQSIADEIVEVKKAAESLGLGSSKVSELKDLMSLLQTMRPSDRNLSDQIKEAKDLLMVLEGDKKPAHVGMSDEVALRLEEMKNNLALQLEQMKDLRQQRDQEFQLRMKQFEIDTQLRRSEVEGKVAVERERNQMLGDLIEGFGGSFTKATVENANTPVARQSNKIIEATEGLFGETACPTCNSVISVAADATQAICPGCHTVYPIRRIPAGVEGDVGQS